MNEEREEFEDNYTLTDNIVEGIKKELRFNNMNILAITEDGTVEYPIDNLLYGFLDDILPATQIYEVIDPSEIKRYYMRPDLFCYDKYGDIDYEWVILALNGILSPKDFTIKKIKVIDPEYLSEILANILSAEDNYKRINRNEYKNQKRY